MSIHDHLEFLWREKLVPRDQRGRIALASLAVIGALLTLVLIWRAWPSAPPPDDSEVTKKLRAIAATRDARNAALATPEPMRAVTPKKR
jgi:hypothetical protein